MDKEEDRVLVVIEKVRVAIVGQRCSNCCKHMGLCSERIGKDGRKYYESYCEKFNMKLLWDSRRKYNGYIRCEPCLQATNEGYVLLEEQE